MLDFGAPDFVMAFPLPDSRGTWDMVNRAKKAGIVVYVEDVTALGESAPAMSEQS
jgi:hypothetical protein